MKSDRPFLLCGILACMFATPSHAQDRHEFLIITLRGAVNTWMLPAEWEAVVKDEHLLLMEGSRTRVSEIAAVRPRRSVAPDRYHEVRLSFPVSSGKTLTQSLWVPDIYTRIEDAPLVDGYYRIDAQTIVRAGGYVVIEQ